MMELLRGYRAVRGDIIAGMGTQTGTADPIALAWSGDDHSQCPECEHERQPVGFSLSTWLRTRLNMKPRRVRCTYLESSVESGDGMPSECGCPNAFHAS